MNGAPRHGEVWWCEFPEVPRRPVVVLSRDAAISRLRRSIVAPCTTTIRHLPTEVLLEPGQDLVPRLSVVNLDTVETVSIGMLTDRLGALSATKMHEVCNALAIATGCA